MLETSEERVKLLKSGIYGKTIEELYLKYNDFKIVYNHVLFKPVESTRQKDKTFIGHEAADEYGTFYTQEIA